MIPTAFNEENTILDGPPGSTADDCSPLSVWRGPLPDGRPVVISCWKPTAKELAEIQQTGRVWIFVWGETMPPIAPSGHYPFTRG